MFTRIILLACTLTASPSLAQWDPHNGLWGKHDPTDIRVMTWNVEDAIRSQNPGKIDSVTDWNACVRIVAGLQPDILLLQETGDNGCGGCVDSVANLQTTIDLFFNGGNDPFLGGEVGSYVQMFAPGYDLPHVFVSVASDGFNRNVILSRFPFADLNGDNRATESEFLVLADAYASTGSVIRGFQFAEIDLPDDTYLGDIVVGNGHLKAGGSTADREQRLEEGKRVAYFIDYLFNGAGTGLPDPNNRIVFPSPPSILPDHTPVVWGGDWNEDELTNGRKGPAEWMIRAEFTGGTDGTDRDRSDSTYDAATDVFTGARGTRNTAKLDYIAWQDSIIEGIRREFVFESATAPSNDQLPEPVRTFPAVPYLASSIAADHRPVIVDIMLPLAVGGGGCNQADLAKPFGILDLADINAFTTGFITQDPIADLAEPLGVFDLADINAFIDGFTSGCP